MSFVISFLKNIAIFFTVLILAVVSFGLISTTALSYWAVTTLQTIPTEQGDPNLKEVTRIGQKYFLEIQQYEEIASDINSSKKPGLCATICNQSSLDQDRLLNERGNYLQSFYKSQKSQALQDPAFRVKIEEMNFLSQVFPKSMRLIVTEILEQPTKAKESPVNLTLKLEGVLLKEMIGVKDQWDQLKVASHKLETLKGLVNSCRSGTKPKQIVDDCKKEFANN